MVKELLLVFVVGGALTLCPACGVKRRPVLYPNERLAAVGLVVAQQDIEECLQKAAAAGQRSRPEGQIAGSTAVGAATGAAVGSAVGAVAGRAGRGAAMGAAGGGAGGLIRGLSRSHDLDPVQRRFVEECLRQKGYQVIGWE